jgi:hypothetical protein
MAIVLPLSGFDPQMESRQTGENIALLRAMSSSSGD